MASIRRSGDRCEIRECRVTERGPRQFRLVRFEGVLTPDVLDAAAGAARRPFDRGAVAARARAMGIPVSARRRSDAAHRLLAELRAGHRLDPALATLLREALAMQPAEPLPEHLEDAGEWIGRSEAERGRALRGLLRAASRVARSRDAVRVPDAEPFPRFSSVGDPIDRADAA